MHAVHSSLVSLQMIYPNLSVTVFAEFLFVTVTRTCKNLACMARELMHFLKEILATSVSFLQIIVIFSKTHAHNTNYPRQERIFSCLVRVLQITLSQFQGENEEKALIMR